jgi:hypothetical protein
MSHSRLRADHGIDARPHVELAAQCRDVLSKRREFVIQSVLQAL